MRGYDTMRIIFNTESGGCHRDFPLKKDYQLNEFDIMICGDITAGRYDDFKKYELSRIDFEKEERRIVVYFYKD